MITHNTNGSLTFHIFYTKPLSGPTSDIRRQDTDNLKQEPEQPGNFGRTGTIPKYGGKHERDSTSPARSSIVTRGNICVLNGNFLQMQSNTQNYIEHETTHAHFDVTLTGPIDMYLYGHEEPGQIGRNGRTGVIPKYGETQQGTLRTEFSTSPTRSLISRGNNIKQNYNLKDYIHYIYL